MFFFLMPDVKNMTELIGLIILAIFFQLHLIKMEIYGCQEVKEFIS